MVSRVSKPPRRFDHNVSGHKDKTYIYRKLCDAQDKITEARTRVETILEELGKMRSDPTAEETCRWKHIHQWTVNVEENLNHLGTTVMMT